MINNNPLKLNPMETDYEHYFLHVIAFNEFIQNQIKKQLDSEPENVFIATTDEGGRFEKGITDYLDILVLSEKDLGKEEFLEKFKELNSNQLFYNFLELKNINSEKISTSKIGSLEVYTPQKFLDMSYLKGNLNILKKAQKKFTEEIKDKSLNRKIYSNVKTSKEICSTGRERNESGVITHFNEGTAFYNPEKNISSFYKGPIQLIQRSLLKDKINAINESKLEKVIFEELPRNTVQAIMYLETSRNTNLTRTEVKDLTDTYQYFLHLYHISQQTYKFANETKSSYNKNEVNERLKSLTRILEKPIIKF